MSAIRRLAPSVEKQIQVFAFHPYLTFQKAALRPGES